MKILKTIGKVIAIILGAIVVLLLIASIHYRIKVHSTMNQLKESGYCNLVSAGDYKLNVLKVGNESGKHKIVCCSGLNDGTMNFSWRNMTKDIEKDNQLIFIDRAGYGFSEDTKTDRTVEKVVEDYRTVLKNMGEEGPYILLGHSISGLYTSYWQNKYPDEIEGVIIMDGTLCTKVDEKEGQGFKRQWYNLSFSEKIGLEPFVMKKIYGELTDIMSKKELDMNLYMFSKTTGAHATISEAEMAYPNAKTVLDNLEPNNIPKLFIDATYHFDEKHEDKEAYWTPFEEKIGNCELVSLHGTHAIYMDHADECAKIIKEHIDNLE
ncbi:MAG: alpha/beta hydrolase [Butyrivibrio sp.]|nr:alpha/beta hydrolase [Butyrivibrio sp.]